VPNRSPHPNSKLETPMGINGICTLANDQVFNQLVALLNSIEVMLGKDFPVCVYPYDDRTHRQRSAL